MDSSVEIAKDLIDMGLGVGDYLFHDVEIWGSGADIGQSTSKTSNDDAHDAHDAHGDNDNQAIDRRRRDDGGDDGGGGDDGSCAQAHRPTYPIGVLGK